MEMIELLTKKNMLGHLEIVVQTTNTEYFLTNSLF